MCKKALSLFHYEGGDNNIQERRTKRKAKMLEYYKQRFRKNLSQLLEEEVSAVTTCEMLEWGSISTTLLLNTSWKSRRLEKQNGIRRQNHVFSNYHGEVSEKIFAEETQNRIS